MNKFKIGDKVKTTLGRQVFTITKIKGDYYRVEENVYLWAEDHLLLVEKKEVIEEQFEVGDIVYNKDSERPLTILRKSWVVCPQDRPAYEYYAEERHLTHKKPLKKITKEQLAEMGYEVENE